LSGTAGDVIVADWKTIFYMAVKIRLKRIGAKNAPVYRVVVADGRSPRDGKFIEEVGTYQPIKKENNFSLNLPRVEHWLSKGAQPSETVASFIKKARKAAPAATATPA
jgi:small subunit ribosomal protein S16